MEVVEVVAVVQPREKNKTGNQILVNTIKYYIQTITTYIVKSE